MGHHCCKISVAEVEAFDGVDDLAEELYVCLDADKNGKISVEEMLRAQVLLAECVHADIEFIQWSADSLKSIDLDNSGDVDPKEFRAHIRSLQEILGVSTLEKALRTQVAALRAPGSRSWTSRPLESAIIPLESYTNFFSMLRTGRNPDTAAGDRPNLSGHFLCGRSALHVLCDHYDQLFGGLEVCDPLAVVPLIKYCLEAKVDPLQKDHMSMTALSCAMIRGQSGLLRAFKEVGCPVDVTALRWAKALLPAREFKQFMEHSKEVEAHVRETGSVPNIILWRIKGVAQVPKIPNNATRAQVQELLSKGASPHGVESNDVAVCDLLVRAGAYIDPRGQPDDIVELLREQYNFRYVKATKLTKVDWAAQMANAETAKEALEQLKKGYSATNDMLIAFCRHFRYAGGAEVCDWFLLKKTDFTGAFKAIVMAHTKAQILEANPMSETTVISKREVIDWFLKRREKTKVTASDMGHLMFDTLCVLYKQRRLLDQDGLVCSLIALRADVNYGPPSADVLTFVAHNMFPESGVVRANGIASSGITCAGILAACRPEEDGKSLDADHPGWNVILEAFQNMCGPHDSTQAAGDHIRRMDPKKVAGPGGLPVLLTMCAEVKYSMRHGNIVLFEYLVETFFNQDVRDWARDNLLDYVFTGSWQIAQRIFTTMVTGFHIDKDKEKSRLAEITKAILLVTQADLTERDLEKCMKYFENGNATKAALEFQNQEGYSALAKAVLSTHAQTLVPVVLKAHPDPNAYVNLANPYTGDTPLIYAARSVYPNNETAMPAVITALIEGKADMEKRNGKNWSALLQASSWEKGKVCKNMLEKTMEPWENVEALLATRREDGDAYFTSILPKLSKMWEEGRLQLVHQLMPQNRLVPTRVVLVADRFMSPLLRLSANSDNPTVSKMMLKHSLQEIASGLPTEAAAWCNLIHQKVALSLMGVLCERTKEVYARCEQLQNFEIKTKGKPQLKVFASGNIFLIGRACDNEPSQYHAFGRDEVLEDVKVDAAKLLSLLLKYGAIKDVEELCSWVGLYSHPVLALSDAFKVIILKKAEQWNIVFQEKMHKLFGKRHTPAPVKQQGRVDDKEVDDYPEEVKKHMRTMTDTRSTEGRVQIAEKLLTVKGGRTVCHKLLDLVRCSILCDSPTQVEEYIEQLLGLTLKTDGVEVMRVKSMFNPNLNVYVNPTFGYRDFKVNVAFDTGDKKDDGTPRLHIGEVQFILGDMLQIKKLMHGLYRIIRGDFQPAQRVYRITLDLPWPPGGKTQSDNVWYLPLDEKRNAAIKKIKEKALDLVNALQVVENKYKTDVEYAKSLVVEARQNALLEKGEPEADSAEDASPKPGAKPKRKPRPRILATMDDAGFADWMEFQLPLIRQTAESTIRDTFFLYGALFNDALDVNLQSLRAGRLESTTLLLDDDEDEDEGLTRPTSERDELLNEGLAEDLDEVKVQELFETMLRRILVPFGADIKASHRLESRLVAQSKSLELRYCRRGMRNKVAPQDLIPVKLYSKPQDEVTFTAGDQHHESGSDDETEEDYDLDWETELKPYIEEEEMDKKDVPENALAQFAVVQEFSVHGEKIGPDFVIHKFESEDGEHYFEYRASNRKQDSQKAIKVHPSQLRSYIDKTKPSTPRPRTKLGEEEDSSENISATSRHENPSKELIERIKQRRKTITDVRGEKFFEEVMPMEQNREEMWARQQVRLSARKAVEARHLALSAAAAASDTNFMQINMWGQALRDFTPGSGKTLKVPPQVLRHKDEWGLIHTYVQKGAA